MLFVSSLPKDSLALLFSTQEGENWSMDFMFPVSPGRIIPYSKNVPNVKSKS